MTLNSQYRDPYDRLPPVAAFDLRSATLVPGKRLPSEHVHTDSGGGNRSPQLEWSGFPPETESFAVTCFDPDAPTGSGFWHWTVVDIAAGTRELPAGAGNSTEFDGSAFHIVNDLGSYGYVGAAPPPGTGVHHYVFAVHALRVASLGIDSSVTSAVARFLITANTIARAVQVVTYSADDS